MVKTVFVVLLLAFYACKPQQPASQDPSDNMKAQAREQLGAQASFHLNQTKSFLLCKSQTQKKSAMSPGQVHFLVFDQANEELLVDKTLEKGTVEWYSDQELLIKTIPGVIKTGETEEDYTYILHVVTGKQRKLNSQK